MYPFKRETEGGLANTEEEAMWGWGAEIGLIWLQAKDCWQPPEAGQGKEQIFPRVLLILWSSFLANETDFKILGS